MPVCVRGSCGSRSAGGIRPVAFTDYARYRYLRGIPGGARVEMRSGEVGLPARAGAAIRRRTLLEIDGMLQELRVENLLLIERAQLRLAPGLNVITGETGAGKSVLAHALDLLLGGRARGGIV